MLCLTLLNTRIVRVITLSHLVLLLLCFLFCQTPPDNSDTIRKRRLRGTMPQSHRFIKWTLEEKKQLQNGVMQLNQKHIIQKHLAESVYMEEREGQMYMTIYCSHSAAHFFGLLSFLCLLLSSVKSQFNSTGSLGSMTAAKFRELSESVESLSPEDYPLEPDEIDWNMIATKYVRTRSAVDCKIQWCGNQDPRINNDPWTKAEDAKLLKLAEQHRAHDWIEIAKQLNVSRRGGGGGSNREGSFVPCSYIESIDRRFAQSFRPAPCHFFLFFFSDESYCHAMFPTLPTFAQFIAAPFTLDSR